MSQDPLSPPRRASRRRYEGNEPEAPSPTNGHAYVKNGRKISIAEAFQRDQELTLEWNGLTIGLRYNPDGLSYKEALELDAMLTPEDGSDPDPQWLPQRLLKVLTGWDLVMDQETQTPYPLTVEGLMDLPPRFLRAILDAMQAANNPPTSTSSSANS